MNTRRGFLTQLAGIGLFTILPGAATYDRIWKAVKAPVFDPSLYQGEWTSNQKWDKAHVIIRFSYNRESFIRYRLSNGVYDQVPMKL